MDKKFNMLKEAEGRLQYAEDRWRFYMDGVNKVTDEMHRDFKQATGSPAWKQAGCPHEYWNLARENDHPEIVNMKFPDPQTGPWGQGVWSKWEHLEDLTRAYQRLLASRKTYDSALEREQEDDWGQRHET